MFLQPWDMGMTLFNILTHRGRATHICVGKLTIIGSDNGLSPDRHQAIIWTNAGILLIGTLWTYFSEILSKIHTFSLNKMHSKMSSAIWRQICLGVNVLNLLIPPVGLECSSSWTWCLETSLLLNCLSRKEPYFCKLRFHATIGRTAAPPVHLPMEILQSCTKPLMCHIQIHLLYPNSWWYDFYR